MTPTVAQIIDYTREAPQGASDTATLVFSNVVAGNWIVLTAQCTGSATRTFTASDDNGNASYTVIARQTGAADGAILYATVQSHAASLTVEVVASAVQNFAVVGYEVADVVAYDASDQYDDAVAADAHTCANPGGAGMATSSNVWICGMGRTDSSAGISSVDPGANYLEEGNAPIPVIAQYRTSDAALSAEYGAWSTTGTNRAAFAFMAAFRGAPTSASLTVSVAEVQG